MTKFALTPHQEAEFRKESCATFNFARRKCVAAKCGKTFTTGPTKPVSDRCAKCTLRGIA